MRVFLTGGAGFIGGRVAALLLARGDTVVAAVRDRRRATGLSTGGADVVVSDLSDGAALRARMTGCDAVIHSAGSYRVGIAKSARPAMWEANVGTTERVLDAATAADVPRIVYVSTVNVFGNTAGQVVDEDHRRDVRRGFVSYYDETKYRAHEAAERRIRDGAPILIAMPGGTYGPGDHSQAGQLLRQAFDGTLRMRALEDAGLAWAHVDDVAAGIVAVLDRGRIGESYVLAGPRHTLGDAMAMAAAIGGRGLPGFTVPTRALRLLAPLANRLPRTVKDRAGLPPDLGEAISASAGVTYWASAAKAERELGFRPRDLETGLRDTLAGGRA